MAEFTRSTATFGEERSFLQEIEHSKQEINMLRERTQVAKKEMDQARRAKKTALEDLKKNLSHLDYNKVKADLEGQYQQALNKEVAASRILFGLISNHFVHNQKVLEQISQGKEIVAHFQHLQQIIERRIIDLETAKTYP